MSIEHEEVRGHVVLRVRGEIEPVTAPRLAEVLTEALGRGRPVVLDLVDVTFLDSAGLAALIEVTERAEDRGEPLRIAVDHNRPVVRPIQITGLEHRLALYESVDAATA